MKSWRQTSTLEGIMIMNGKEFINMAKRTLLNIALLTKDLFLSPNRIFENIKIGRFTNEIYIVFILSMIITLLKSFFVKHYKTVSLSSFFNNDFIDKLMVWLRNPQVSWATAYLSYGIFIYFVFRMCKLFNNKTKFKQVMLSLMSISGYEIVIQIIYYFSKYILSNTILLCGVYFILIWTIWLSIMAIKVSLNISNYKSILCVILPAMPFLILVYFVGISPYLLWLNL